MKLKGTKSAEKQKPNKQTKRIKIGFKLQLKTTIIYTFTEMFKGCVFFPFCNFIAMCYLDNGSWLKFQLQKLK